MDLPAVGAQPQAGPSILTPASSPYQESSQFLHWRYTSSNLHALRDALNAKSVEVVGRNSALEKEAQISLGHAFTDPPPPTTYLSVDDELVLLRFYCVQASKICRQGFGLPEIVEATAISYLKRFYLKNSVMEWHPKTIMPTCLFLAAKTTNYPVPVDQFVTKIAKLSPTDVLDTEFLVAQSLGFEFWVRGGEKALRGWNLELQSRPETSIEALQAALPIALDHLKTSRLTDAEFIYTPSQIGLACFRIASPSLVDEFLSWRYEDDPSAYGVKEEQLLNILDEITSIVQGAGTGELDSEALAKVKEVDKRLRRCTNPEKVPGTALYIKRKKEQDTTAVAAKAAKSLKSLRDQSDRETVFGDIIQPDRKPLSPRVTVAVDRGVTRGDGVPLEQSGMGVKDEAMGMLVGGNGLREVGRELEDDD